MRVLSRKVVVGMRIGRLFGSRAVMLMMPCMLREGRRGQRRRAGERQGQPDHAAVGPSSGRTVTTRIMPACMW
jgi:hypothetical protein